MINENWSLYTKAEWLLETKIAAYSEKISLLQKQKPLDSLGLDGLLGSRSLLLEELDRVSPYTPDHSKDIIRRLLSESDAQSSIRAKW